MILRPSWLSILGWAALPLAFTAMGVWMVVEGAIYGWFFILFFGLFAVLVLAGLADRLVLDDNGFRCAGPLRTATLAQRWEDLGPIGVEREDVWSRVSWHNLRTGQHGSLPHAYGMSAPELAAVMEGFRTGQAPATSSAEVRLAPLTDADRTRVAEAHAQLGRLQLYGWFAGVFLGGLSLFVDNDESWIGLVLAAVVLSFVCWMGVQRMRDVRSGQKEVVVGAVQQRNRATTQTQVLCSVVVGGVEVSVPRELCEVLRPGDRLRIERTRHTRRVILVDLC